MNPNYNYSAYTNPYLPRTNPYQPQEYNNGIIWVQGIEGAKAYQMQPNQILQLMDSENDGIFYIKVADNIGMANLRVFRYTEINSTDMKPSQTDINLSEYVRKDELKELIAVAMKEANDESTVQPAKPSKSSRLIPE